MRNFVRTGILRFCGISSDPACDRWCCTISRTETATLRAVVLSAVVILAGAYAVDAAYADVAKHPPPFQQQRDGVALYDIQCNEPRELYIRDSQMPVCITAPTYELLSGYGMDLVLASSASPETGVQQVVEETIEMYKADGEETFARINAMESHDPAYPFVFTFDTTEVVAHGADPDLVGAGLLEILTPDRPLDAILADLDRDGGTWVEYTFLNPATDRVEYKVSWFYLHDGYIFGSGHYASPETRVQQVVEETIEMYKADGEETFARINAMESHDPAYPFVFTFDTTEVVAHGADPDLVGAGLLEILTPDHPLDAILADLDRDGGTWVEYTFLNPATDRVEYKVSWFYLHDGYIFGSGHYASPETRVQQVVEETIEMYKADGEETFARINAMESHDPAYPFVFTFDTTEVVAHGADPDLVGAGLLEIPTPDRPLDAILADLDRDGGTWVEYTFLNPATDRVEYKVSWFYLHDGYIFGSGHYASPETRVQQVVEETIEMYKADGEETFARINAMESHDPAYPFVFTFDTTEVVAHGADPDLVGAGLLEILTPDRPLDAILADLDRDGGTWVEYTFLNPATDRVEYKVSWFYLHDGYIFGSGHYASPETRVQQVVEETIEMYKADGEETFARINAMESHDPAYPFVFTFDTTEVVAHGADPDLVGAGLLEILTPDRPLDARVGA